MTIAEKFAKAERIQAKLIAEYKKEKDFAEAMALWMVLNGCYKVKRAIMAAFLAGPSAAERFRSEIESRG